MGRQSRREILRGIHSDEQGKIHIEADLSATRERVTLRLCEATHLPIEVEHVLEAIGLALEAGILATDYDLSSHEEYLVTVL